MTTLYRKTATAVSSLLAGRNSHDYQTVARTANDREEEDESGTSEQRRADHPSLRRLHTRRFIALITIISILIAAIVTVLVIKRPRERPHNTSCPSTIDADIQHGYNCHPRISHSWGQYSPYHSIPSPISPKVPEHCNITFLQVLSRHGARHPTLGKSILYSALITQIQDAIAKGEGKLDKKYEFLRSYIYALRADDLVEFGEEELWNLGRKIREGYPEFLKGKRPFVRTTSQTRMTESAQWWMAGYYSVDICKSPADLWKLGCRPHRTYTPAYEPDVIITEAPGFNNTLSHSTCPAFERSRSLPSVAIPFAESFTAPIARRLNHDLFLPLSDSEDFSLGTHEVLYLMDLCPFNTVANFDQDHEEKYRLPPLSPFCHLFTELEWQSYDYFQSLSKYHTFGPGAPLGATQGVGWVNELVSRLTGKMVDDHTTTNSSLEFPLNGGVYADFSHDNDMISIFSALRLFDNTLDLPPSHIVRPGSREGAGFAASWAVPFGGRLVVEGMRCRGRGDNRMGVVEEKEREKEREEVRVILNDRVVPLEWCGGNEKRGGRCRLDKFVKGLEWARRGGEWGKCYEGEEDEGN